MQIGTETLANKASKLQSLVLNYEEKLSEYEKEIKILREQIRFLESQKFGKSSEAITHLNQVTLFDEAEDEVKKSAETETSDVKPHTRKKRVREPLPEFLPRVDTIIDIPEEDKTCTCGSVKKKIGEDVSEKLEYIPATLEVHRNIRPKYACRSCEGLEDAGPVVSIAPTPPQMIPKSIAGPGLLAHILTAKFCDALPFYRQEKQLCRLGIHLPRQTMCHWVVHVAMRCAPLIKLLKQGLLSGPLLHIDETRLQVMGEVDRSNTTISYMWVFRGGPIKSPTLLFEYHPTRSCDAIKDIFETYDGATMTDGYAGYNQLENNKAIIHAGCWAHVRRKFIDVQKAIDTKSKSSKTGAIDVAIGTIKKLYAIERRLAEQNADIELIKEERRVHVAPILDEFKRWLDKKITHVPPKSLMGKAVAYTLNQWPKLIKYRDHPTIPIDNNPAENAIRPFVIGRKNWLFSGSTAGASASAAIYSLIETAKANNIEPYAYLKQLFVQLPLAETEDDYKNLLPYNIKIQS